MNSTMKIVRNWLKTKQIPAIARGDGSYKVDAGWAKVIFVVGAKGEFWSWLYVNGCVKTYAINLAGFVSLVAQLDAE